MEFAHTPVLLREVLEWLRVRPGATYADGTLGGGGHSEALLEQSSPDGKLYACDRDRTALEAASQRLARFGERFVTRHGNFSSLAEWVPHGTCDGVLLDLGVSSPQLDVAERGFSFQEAGPLDMRMDRSQELTAADLVNRASAEELAKIFWEFGGETESRRIARAIVRDREIRPFVTTKDLAGLLERIMPRGGKKRHPATKVFQALRIAVNAEMESLARGLDGAVKLLKPGGRLAIITFHSLEDRFVKDFGNKLSRGYEIPGEVDVPELRKPVPPVLKWVSRKAIAASPEEEEANPRSRSAQLRVLERL